MFCLFFQLSCMFPKVREMFSYNKKFKQGKMSEKQFVNIISENAGEHRPLILSPAAAGTHNAFTWWAREMTP